MSKIIGSANSQTQRIQETLADQKVGYKGVIHQLSGDQHILSRLRELGFVPGHQVRLKSKTLFSDPLVVEIKGGYVALRRREAQCIQL